ncbi:DNA-binding NarL/FixJ family response regulator [Actinoplanes lutulentus]|uniref:LuxR family two component transcriptional regulator n=1 Tax=Actinoplanes lutulentus TaxID=1287878 RepID=A0A327ZIF2_9ACTN|nr:LuxR C-terminal-related transcriptional regulator [Actinoplanes lutulentus]MBB2945231.1 DNA-binding NarL/FixJ family response regulator [Actinoplanes lutulentus]RAK40633.1 LuxR family two component transcriptional regulator [Actinoplanes lutulentus]
MQNGIRVVVVDGRAAFVRALESLIPEVSGGRATVVATTGEVGKVASVMRAAVPDLVLVDPMLQPPGNRHPVTLVHESAPQARIVAVADDPDHAMAVEALHAGAAALLRRGMDVSELRQPLLAALEGWAVVPPALLAALLEQARPRQPHPVATHLDDEDRRLLRMIAGGSSTSDIAGLLHVSERTVKRLTASLLRKLKVASRTEAAALAGSAGLI